MNPARSSDADDTRETVVLVHGLWFGPWIMRLLQRRLRACGFRCVTFSYRSVVDDLYASAARLDRFVRCHAPTQAHLVGYSLGGLVIRALFAHHPAQPPGRIVTLGSPHQGSFAAQALYRYRPLRRVLGRGIADLLARVPPTFAPPSREFGSIAGDLSIGGGRLFAQLAGPNDGTVTVAETEFAGASAHVVLPVSHLGLMTSAAVARQVCRFLRSGRFDR